MSLETFDPRPYNNSLWGDLGIEQTHARDRWEKASPLQETQKLELTGYMKSLSNDSYSYHRIGIPSGILLGVSLSPTQVTLPA